MDKLRKVKYITLREPRMNRNNNGIVRILWVELLLPGKETAPSPHGIVRRIRNYEVQKTYQSMAKIGQFIQHLNNLKSFIKFTMGNEETDTIPLHHSQRRRKSSNYILTGPKPFGAHERHWGPKYSCWRRTEAIKESQTPRRTEKETYTKTMIMQLLKSIFWKTR